MKAIQLELINGKKYTVDYGYFIDGASSDKLERNEDKRLENEMQKYRMFKKFKDVDGNVLFINVGEIITIEEIDIADR